MSDRAARVSVRAVMVWFTGVYAISSSAMGASDKARHGDGRAARPSLSVVVSKDRPETSVFSPLETVVLSFEPAAWTGHLVVRDGVGRVYVDEARAHTAFRFSVMGALGMHSVELSNGVKVAARIEMAVEARTRIRTGSGLIDEAIDELAGQLLSAGHDVFVDGGTVRYYVPGLRGNNQALRAARYLDADVKNFPSLFFRHRNDTGSLFGRFSRDDHFDPYGKTFPGVHFERDLYGAAYAGRSSDQRFVFDRSPVEADIESLAIEYAYQAWQASGDDRWIGNALPALENGLRYLLRDPLRFSTEHGLIKRGFTIDMWNLQHPISERLHPRGNRNRAGWTDMTWVDADSHMGIMHGDNSAAYGAAVRLARLHGYLGNSAKAAEWTDTAERLRTALNQLCWNGTFYRHFVHLPALPETVDLGTNESRQLSFSNPLDIHRGVTTQAQAVSIISEYRRRREKTRHDSVAEWFTIDPPFANGFGYMAAGEFVNGTVTPALAGDLALAAFRHGVEGYAVDILKRVVDLRKKYGTLSALYYRGGRQPGWVAEEFSTVDLRAIANRHLRGDRPNGFIGHPDNDLREFPVGRHEFLGKPFDVIDPAANGDRGAVVLWGSGSPGPRQTTVSGIGRKARSLYFLHSVGKIAIHSHVGEYVIGYSDGTRTRVPLVVGRNINNWWDVDDVGESHVAWRGKNPHVSTVAMGVWGWNNRYPDKIIDSITISAAGEGRVQLLGITLSSAPAQFAHADAARWFPPAWAIGPVFAAMIEGLAGVTDEHKVFEHVTLAPRFLMLDERRADVTVRYPSSHGYVAYRWEHRADDKTIRITATGSGRRFDFHVPLPGGVGARHVNAGGVRVRFENTKVEETPYVDFQLAGPVLPAIEIAY